jgi:RHS repeat-associated protein
MQYDDAYRLRRLDVMYGTASSGEDRFSPPDPNSSLLPRLRGTNRVRWQTFDFDWLGNTTATNDNEGIRDRSLGSIKNGIDYGTGKPHTLVVASRGGGDSVVPSYDVAGETTGIVAREATCPTNDCNRSFTYSWDEVGRLARAIRVMDATNAAVEERFVYDAAGNRIIKSVVRADGVLVAPLHTVNIFESLRLENARFDGVDYEQTVDTERVFLTAGGTSIARVFYTQAGLPAGAGKRLNVFFTLTDSLGSTGVVIDKATSEVVERSRYQAYGATESDYQPERWGGFRESFRYTGHEDDAEVGLINFGQRYYAPMLGRWLNPDPLSVHKMRADLNPYAFVFGSPMRFSDPLGLSPPPGCDDLSPGCSSGWTFNPFDAIGALGKALGGLSISFNAHRRAAQLSLPASGTPVVSVIPQGPVYALTAGVYNFGIQTLGSTKLFLASPGGKVPEWDGVGDFIKLNQDQIDAIQWMNSASMPLPLDDLSARAYKATVHDLVIASFFNPGGSKGGLFLAENKQLSLVGLEGFTDLARFRAEMTELGFPETGTLSRLDIADKSFYGMSGPGVKYERMPHTNFQVWRHAEGDAVGQAMAAGMSGGRATLWVDRLSCDFCAPVMPGLAGALELDELILMQPGMPPLSIKR